MKRYKLIVPVLIITLATSSFLKLFHEDDWKYLFNGKDLGGWDTWIGPPLDDAGKKLSETPVGLNNDPDHVFTIVKDKGENAIRISGEKWGGISTKIRGRSWTHTFQIRRMQT